MIFFGPKNITIDIKINVLVHVLQKLGEKTQLLLSAREFFGSHLGFLLLKWLLSVKVNTELYSLALKHIK